MKIVVLNGSPRANGNTVAMIASFEKGATEAGHTVTRIDVCEKQIAGCRGCEYCHTKGNGSCIQKDDMGQVIAELTSADMLVLASPIYYFGLTGQLQCAIHRTYALGKLTHIKRTALIMSSGAADVYDGAISEYHQAFTEWMNLEDMGIFTAYGSQNKSPRKLQELYNFGRSL
ncbi:MAG: flavodoxin family protein [Eggerthellaceae bacterium]|jgi:multimeric flavodoxin WrbA|nr:flavodoxin family protein [Eggerthellaceae bacterium]MCH4221202.1 flavodoxin family protein [Eggerthellaceae bacterium]